jgi:GNAT superfamily N-acetyltransferase
MLGAVTVRPVVASDDDFLRLVYASTRIPELSVLGWPDEQLDAFIRMQFDAQARHYDAFYPEATRSVVIVDGDPGGRLIVDRSDGTILIVDVALLPEVRRIGVGSRLMRPLLEEADAGGWRVRCHVALGNDARLFWEHLGMVATGVDGAHVAMQRECATPESTPFGGSSPR